MSVVCAMRIEGLGPQWVRVAQFRVHLLHSEPPQTPSQKFACVGVIVCVDSGQGGFYGQVWDTQTPACRRREHAKERRAFVTHELVVEQALEEGQDAGF